MERDLWSVRFVVTHDESGPLSNAYAPTLDLEDAWGAEFGGWSENDLEPQPYFTIHVQAETAEAATRKAQAQLSRMRQYAGLAELGLVAPEWVAPLGGPDGHRFMTQAKDLVQAECYELAIVAAQIHFEHQARLTLGLIGARPQAPLWARRLAKGGYGPLHKPAGLAVVELMIGEDISGSTAWPEYTQHVALRNKIVHEGASATRDDAVRSIRAVQAVWTRLTAAARSSL